MSISVNQDDLKLNNQTIDIKKSSDDNSAPVNKTTGNSTANKAIFEGMTKAQAKSMGILDEFNKANIINPDDEKISKEEFIKYNADKGFVIVSANINTDQLVTNTKNVYNKQVDNKMAKEHLSYQEAQDALYHDNMKGLANAQASLLKQLNLDPKKMDLKNAKKITDAQLNDIIAITKEKLHVHAGMTRAEAEQKGGETLKNFNIISNGKDTINEVDIAEYKKNRLVEKGISVESIIKTVQDTSDKEMQMKLYGAFINTMTDESDVREDFKDIKNLDGFRDKLGISKEEWENAKTPEEKGKILASAFSKIIKQDINLNDENSRIYSEIKDIAQGHFKQDELDKGYAVGDKLSQNELMKLAMGRIVKEYASTIAQMSKTVFSGVNDSEKQAVVESLFGSLNEMKDLRQVLESMGLNSMTEGSKEQIETTKHVAKNETESEDFDASSVTGAMVTTAIVQHGDEQTVNDFIVNNKNQVDVIKSVANSAVDSMADGDRKTSLQNTVNKAVKTAETMNTQNSQQKGKNVSADKKAAPKTSETPVVSNPILDNKGNNVSSIAQKSHEFMRNTKLTPQQIRQEEIRKQQEQIVKQAEELHQKMGVAIEGLKNKPPEKALSIVFSHYDQMPGTSKTYFINYLKRQFNEHTDALCEIYLKGDNTVRQFLQSQHIMSISDVYAHLDEHPEDLKYADKTLEVNYKAHKAKTLMKEMTTKTDFENKADAMTYSYWPDLQGIQIGWGKMDHSRFRKAMQKQNR